ncbi:hypothetical protein [Paenibacillus alvei]|uniref:hypothetical protein n=1 Tax=Paenibacillus alvei TaxID=44250 RepID=UPI003B75D2D5
MGNTIIIMAVLHLHPKKAALASPHPQKNPNLRNQQNQKNLQKQVKTQISPKHRSN